MQQPRPRRNRTLDFVRIALAAAVLFSHAWELSGDPAGELLNRLTRTGMSLGSVAVTFFFLLSGYLIVGSWVLDPRLRDFVLKRLLRILPGYVMVGLLAPGIPHFFRAFFEPPWGAPFGMAFVTLSATATPPVLPGLPVPAVNNSLWTLSYEVRCYLLVAMFGMLGLLRRRVVWLLFTALAFSATRIPVIVFRNFPHALVPWLGWPPTDALLCFAFFVGGSFFLYRDVVRFHWGFALVAAATLIACLVLNAHAGLAIVLLGGYLLFFLGTFFLPDSRWRAKVPDVSYGMYIYGWPIEELWIWYRHPAPWVTFLLSLGCAAVMGFLSWHFVERPMLRKKPRPSAPMPSEPL
jgi:peptidoglycan/LPS O-acetylase OafA/YrhL